MDLVCLMILRPKHFVVERRDGRKEKISLSHLLLKGLSTGKTKSFLKLVFLEVNMLISKF